MAEFVAWGTAAASVALAAPPLGWVVLIGGALATAGASYGTNYYLKNVSDGSEQSRLGDLYDSVMDWL